MWNKHALVVAYLALLVALSGAGYAAVKITGKQVKNGSLTSVDVKDRSLLGKDFKAGQLPQGPPGAQGSEGPQGVPGTARGWIDVPNTAPDNTAVDSPPRSKGVNGYEKVVTTAPDHISYCFDLSFTPNVGVASPFFNNNAIIAIGLGPDYGGGLVTGCPAPYTDAKAVVRDTANGEHGDVRFSIFFE
jgi:hypothetical protein